MVANHQGGRHQGGITCGSKSASLALAAQVGLELYVLLIIRRVRTRLFASRRERFVVRNFFHLRRTYGRVWTRLFANVYGQEVSVFVAGRGWPRLFGHVRMVAPGSFHASPVIPNERKAIEFTK